MIRIVFVSHYQNRGGANIEMCSLIDSLLLTGKYSISVVMPGYGWLYEQLMDKCRCIVVKYHRWVEPEDAKKLFLKRFLKWIINWIAAYNLYFKFHNEHIDVIHTNDSLTVVGAYLARLLHTRHIWHIREIFDEALHLKHTFGEKYAERWLSSAEYVIAVSEAVKNRYCRYSDINIVKIYDGVDCSNISNNKDGKNAILFCGGTAKQKGIFDVLEAAAILKKDGFKCKFIVAGSCNFSGEIASFIRKNELEDFIDFIGFKSNLDSFWKSGNTLLMCSTGEAFGLVTVEGMLHNCLVIGRKSGGTTEIIEHYKTGLLYNTTEELADYIKFSFLDESNSIRRQGRIYALDNFNIEKTRNEISKLYSNE